MDPDQSTEAPAASPPGARVSWRKRWHVDRASIPAAAVAAMAVVSVTTAVMMSRQRTATEDARPLSAVAQTRRNVEAPPLVVKAPPLNPPGKVAQAGSSRDPARATHSAGAAAGCRNCGVVESVAAKHPSAYQMRVRMDDGTLRSIEQPAAFPAGSRVVLEGGTVRAATENG
jgi:hypothetical protein